MALKVAERAKQARKRIRGRRRAPRTVRARRLGAVVAVLGVMIASAFLAMPVDAKVDRDPLMRLRTFDAAPVAAPPVACGTALGEARAGSGGATLYDLARDHACRDASLRRVLTAGAAGSVVLLSGLLALAAASSRLTRKGAFA
ncbi:MAG: hypothetical protein QOI99_872 [Actinomycetota bacterium]|jgi:hypothetical protein|nr:hypothetical protein [Actinomycetota bacterium]